MAAKGQTISFTGAMLFYYDAPFLLRSHTNCVAFLRARYKSRMDEQEFSWGNAAMWLPNMMFYSEHFSGEKAVTVKLGSNGEV